MADTKFGYPGSESDGGAGPSGPSGARIHIRRLGSGLPLVLLHGFTGSGESWGEPLLDRLAHSRTVFVVDLPGHGRSERPADPVRYEIGRLRTDLLETLSDLGVDRADWLGYSMGGRVALHIAAHAPHRVDRLILESASPGIETEEERARRRSSDEAWATRLESDGIGPFVDAWMDQEIFASQRRREGGRVDSARRAALRSARLDNDPLALAACLRGLGQGVLPSLWPQWKELRVPTTLLVGSEDAKYRSLAERMVRANPSSRAVTIPDAGHTIHLENPDRWCVLVEQVLGAEAECS